MLKPNKHMNLDKSIINITALMLVLLKKQKIIEYSELLEKTQSVLGEDIRYNFLQSLNLLYLLGKINYYPESDLFELID